jgi:hypothetical protein
MGQSEQSEYLTSRNYRCKDCGHHDVSYGFIKGDDFLLDTFDPCERCESTNLDFLLSVPNIDRFGERFPYFDRGLGQMVTSKKHRLEVCKKKGVVPIDGDIDYSDDYNKLVRKHEEEDKIVEDIQDKVENHPGYADYRKQKDQGWSPEFKHRPQNDAGVDPFNEE